MDENTNWELEQVAHFIMKHCPDLGKRNISLNIANMSDMIVLLTAISLSETDTQPFLDARLLAKRNNFGVVDKEKMGKSFDLSIISGGFYAPDFGGEDNYYASQYLCEFIKELGVDLARFYSSFWHK